MKTKMAVVASLLLVSVQTTSAQYYDYYNRPVENFYYQYGDTAAAENDLANAKALRDKARKQREETGKSDVGARLRLWEMFGAVAVERAVVANLELVGRLLGDLVVRHEVKSTSILNLVRLPRAAGNHPARATAIP